MLENVISHPLCEVIASVTTAQPTIATVRPSSNSVSMTLTQSIGEVSSSALMAQLRSQVHRRAESAVSSQNKIEERRSVSSCDLTLEVRSVKERTESQGNAGLLMSAMNLEIPKVKNEETKPQYSDSSERVAPPLQQSLNVVMDSKTLQLSPTLENKLASSTGIIENLDRFCAVADIITETVEVEDDEEIDIENEDDIEENPILQNRSASPNSVYEKLLKAANAAKRNSPIKRIHFLSEKKGHQVLVNGVSDSHKKEEACEGCSADRDAMSEDKTGASQEGATSMCSVEVSEEDWSSEIDGSLHYRPSKSIE